VKTPPHGWRTPERLLREFRQGGQFDRWSERRFLILMKEFRLFCRQELAGQVMTKTKDEVWSHEDLTNVLEELV
jgi:hypothetical protein